MELLGQSGVSVVGAKDDVVKDLTITVHWVAYWETLTGFRVRLLGFVLRLKPEVIYRLHLRCERLFPLVDPAGYRDGGYLPVTPTV